MNGSGNNGDNAHLTTFGANSAHPLTSKNSGCTLPIPHEHIQRISAPGISFLNSHVFLCSQSRQRSIMAGKADFQTFMSPGCASRTLTLSLWFGGSLDRASECSGVTWKQ